MSNACTRRAVDKALKKQARLAEADTLRRIAEAAKAPAPKSIKKSSPQRPTSLFQKSSKFNPSTPSWYSLDHGSECQLYSAGTRGSSQFTSCPAAVPINDHLHRGKLPSVEQTICSTHFPEKKIATIVPTLYRFLCFTYPQ